MTAFPMTTDPEESAELDRMLKAGCTCCGVTHERACQPWCGLFGGIDTPQKYVRAMAEVARRVDADPEKNTPDGERLLALATAIEAYEKKHWPLLPGDDQ